MTVLFDGAIAFTHIVRQRRQRKRIIYDGIDLWLTPHVYDWLLRTLRWCAENDITDCHTNDIALTPKQLRLYRMNLSNCCSWQSPAFMGIISCLDYYKRFKVNVPHDEFDFSEPNKDVLLKVVINTSARQVRERGKITCLDIADKKNGYTLHDLQHASSGRFQRMVDEIMSGQMRLASTRGLL